MTLEHQISNEIRLYCGEHNILCFHINVFKGEIITKHGKSFIQSGVPNGFPDLLCIANGKTFYCEVKTPTGKLRADQIKFIKVLQEHKQLVCVASSIEEFIAYIKKEALI